LELVGAAGVAAVLPLVAIGARIVVIGVGAGAKLDLNLLSVMASRATIGGSTLRARDADEKAAVAEAVGRDVLPLLEQGTIRVHVSETIPMEEAARGYERFGTAGKFGKIVLMNG
jgi:NADPH2:quinone reductase